MEKIAIPIEEYNELRRKAEAYDKISASNSQAGKKSAANLTPEQRRERAQKAVAARIAKYSQKSQNRRGNATGSDATS